MEEVIIDQFDPGMIEIELPSTPSQSEPEMENMMTDDHCYATMSVVSELSTFLGINCLPLSTSTPQKNDSGEEDSELSSPTSNHARSDDHLTFTSPSTSDAVVPCESDLKSLQIAHGSPVVLKRGDKMSFFEYTFNSYNLLLAGFETFEKIQLWSEDGEGNDDTCLGDMNDIPALPSLSGQMLELLQQLYQPSPKSECSEHPVTPEEEEKSEDEDEQGSTCGALLNFISEADVATASFVSCESVEDCFDQVEDEVKPHSSAKSSGVHTDSICSIDSYPKFEMKKQFDLVLKELHTFIEISRSDLITGDCSSSESSSDDTKFSEGNGSECNEYLSSPEVERPGDCSSDFDRESRVEMCVSDPELHRPTVIGNGEQEVPRCSDLHQETPTNSDGAHTGPEMTPFECDIFVQEPLKMEQKGKTWSPSFACQPHPEQQSHRQPEPVRRLEPLKTCKRPIRVGLSKNAKIKRLY